jgi:glycosyltransferase involved in cell wall biosynthesis
MEVWNREVIGVPARKSRMLANGIDAERFRVRGENEARAFFGQDDIVIGTVGRIQDVKDHATLIDAFLLLRDRSPLRPRLRLAIVGDGPLLPAMRAKAQAAGVANVVWLPGARTDVPDILRSFDVFAMSSIAEGTPGSALEAMASGLPVVGTRVGGIPEVIDDGVTGLLVPPSDAAAMAAALEQYIVAPALAHSHGAAGRERVQRKYSMAAMVAAYQDLYDTLYERKTKIRRAVPSCAE